MQRKIVTLFLLLILSSLIYAQEKTFIREYTHKVGDADSKITSRAIALNQVKKILLEEIGVYLESTFEIEKTETSEEYKELTNSQITSITAGITETKILEEKWNGIEFFIKAEITIDVDDMLNKLNKIAQDRDKTKQLVEANTRTDQAITELNQIREKLKETISEKEKLHLHLEYAKNSNILSASDWVQKGRNATELNEYDNAILYYQKAIKLDPNFASAYNYMGIVYDFKGNDDKAIECYQKAMELDQSNADFFYNQMGRVYRDKGDYDKAIEYFKKTIELDPSNDWAYYDLGRCFDLQGHRDSGIYYIKKAAYLGLKKAQDYLKKNNISW